MKQYIQCPACKGETDLGMEGPCSRCNGTGKISNPTRGMSKQKMSEQIVEYGTYIRAQKDNADQLLNRFDKQFKTNMDLRLRLIEANNEIKRLELDHNLSIAEMEAELKLTHKVSDNLYLLLVDNPITKRQADKAMEIMFKVEQ